MSWIQNLYETYEMCQNAVGIASVEQEKMLLPIGHILFRAAIEIHLNEEGSIIDASKDIKKKNESQEGILICSPCTDESEGRAGKSAKDFPHPLFDQIKYLLRDAYMENLYEWLKFTKKNPIYQTSYTSLNAVYQYVRQRTLFDDLKQRGIHAKDTLGVRFCVKQRGTIENRLWMIPEMWDAWINFYLQQNNERGKSGICYASGKLLPITEKHPKSINRASGNAKLITGNDSSNFTYRGRFDESTQAVIVSYEASQKAHQALRWLISTRAYRCNTQAILTWAVDQTPDVTPFYDDSYGIYEIEEKTDADKLIEVGNKTFIDYAKWLKTALLSSGNSARLRSHIRRIAVMITDAATTGRMSVTYYRELYENEYLERITNWHDTCKWYQILKRDNDGKRQTGYFIGAPSVDRITEAVLGKRRKRQDDTYDKMKKAVRERLLHCILDGEKIPLDMVNTALHRASNPIALEKGESKNAFDRWYDWEQILCAACALMKRYYHDYEKEEYDLELEESRTNRDYLYGRLLAIADAIESHARHKQGNAKDDVRATNAIRYMTAFSQHPFRTWNILWNQLNPYIQQLNGADWYLTQIGNIKVLFDKGDFESDTSLDGKYLLGFFAQRQKLRTKSQKSNINGGEKNELKEQN